MGDEGRENLPRRRRSDETRSRRSIKETKTITPYLMGEDDEARENEQEARRTESRSMTMEETTTKEENDELDHEERIKSGYQVRQGERVCGSYRHTGLCLYGTNCLFDHPRCKFFLRGACKEGSACKFIHEKDTNEPPMRQAISSMDSDGEEPPMRQGSRRHETESTYRTEEKKETTKDWVLDIEKKYNRSLSQICDGIVAGYKREQMEKEQTHGQDGLQELRQRENTEGQRWRESLENVKEPRQRDTSKEQGRESQKNVKDQILMGIAANHKVGNAHGQDDNLQVERQRESIEWQTREAQEMRRRKSKAFLEEQRVKDKLDKKRQRDVEKLEVEPDKCSVEQRSKAKAIPDSKGVERFKDISQIHDEIVAGYKRARKMVKKVVESDQRLKGEEACS